MAKNRSNNFGAHSKKTAHLNVIPPSDSNTLKPIFSLYYIKYGKYGCLSVCEMKDKALTADFFSKISQSTWNQIISMPRDKGGFEKINRKRFIKAVSESLTPDVSDLLVFRFSDVGRIAGFRTRDIFHVVVIDPKHAFLK